MDNYYTAIYRLVRTECSSCRVMQQVPFYMEAWPPSLLQSVSFQLFITSVKVFWNTFCKKLIWFDFGSLIDFLFHSIQFENKNLNNSVQCWRFKYKMSSKLFNENAFKIYTSQINSKQNKSNLISDNPFTFLFLYVFMSRILTF